MTAETPPSPTSPSRRRRGTCGGSTAGSTLRGGPPSELSAASRADSPAPGSKLETAGPAPLRESDATPLPGLANRSPGVDRDSLTQAWGNGILHNLPARAKALYSAGRSSPLTQGGSLCLPNAAHRDRCVELAPQVEAALRSSFGRGSRSYWWSTRARAVRNPTPGCPPGLDRRRAPIALKAGTRRRTARNSSGRSRPCIRRSLPRSGCFRRSPVPAR